jgi:hypothetical protein
VEIETRPRELAAIDVPHTPIQHLRLALFGVVARVIESCAGGDVDAALERHPFLAEYLDEMGTGAPAGDSIAAGWWRGVCAWEREAVRRRVHLPLVALRDAGLSALELELLLAVGLTEEDPRFGAVFEDAQRDQRRPTFGLLMAWWRDADERDRADDVRNGLQRLIDEGLVHLRNADAPRAEWVLAPAPAIWDGLRGRPPSLGWLRYVPSTDLVPIEDLVLPDAVRVVCGALPELLSTGPAPLLLLRGPVRNGRKTLAGALARALGRAVLIARDAVFEDAARWRAFGALATMTNALPVVDWELALGEIRVLPPLPSSDTPIVVVTGRHGAWDCLDRRPIFAIDLPLPAPEERLRHWRASLPASADALPACAVDMRLSSGHIRAVAAAAAGFARVSAREVPDPDDLRRACRTLQSARLETLATRLEARGSLRDLAVDDSTREELEALVARCRHREALAARSAAVADGGAGVRALFAGPSGSGKTLSARLLAAQLGKELYRVDLAATVNKYLGETEKSLNRTLTAAEELDVVLLIDEGDALMANRTDVGSSNDRYANLETNFLLQRIESFEGILLVTTNAIDRIDRAFARRMDVVVPFRPPDAWRRFEILKLHLAGDDVSDGWLEDAASRCALSGGQLRNAVMHARLLSLQDGHALDEGHLQAALAREYRKTGAISPLRPLQAKR